MDTVESYKTGSRNVFSYLINDELHWKYSRRVYLTVLIHSGLNVKISSSRSFTCVSSTAIEWSTIDQPMWIRDVCFNPWSIHYDQIGAPRDTVEETGTVSDSVSEKDCTILA